MDLQVRKTSDVRPRRVGATYALAHGERENPLQGDIWRLRRLPRKAAGSL
ncbi:MAG: hypothetical protein ACLTSX_13835 [Collinsella sp.]